ncbi:MAG: cytidylate kinase family protein, partial [bacterium]
DYIRHLADVINSVSMLGGVVVVGRGANFIVGRDRGFNIRVIAPAECRRANLSEYQGLGAADAAREVEVSDRERSEFIRRYFGKDIDDANHYDMVINTAQISMETVINAVSVAALDKFERIRPR